MNTLAIRNVYLPEHEDRLDILIDDGVITSIEHQVAVADKEIQGNGVLLIPGFVESHIHLDKACILDRCHNEEGTLEGAIASVSSAKKAFTHDDVYQRGKRVLEKAIVQGTNAMRAHVEIDPGIGLIGFEALVELKKDFSWAMDLQLCVFPQEGLTNYPGTQELLESALKNGADLLGGCPYTDTNPHEQIRVLFAMAASHDVDLDFHLDFDLDPTWRHLDEIVRQTKAYNWQGRVAIGHVSKFSALPRDELMQTVTLLCDAGIALTVLPATDLFLMGRGSDCLVPRGVAPAHLFHESGVCCTIATNNVLNPFTPYGDCSLSRMANLYANVHQLGATHELESCFAMVTASPRRLLNLNQQILVGQDATFVALDARWGSQVVAEIIKPMWGMKRGRKTFEQTPARIFEPDA